jgi:alpha-glucoside transport system substrate-binding protein
VMPPTLRKAFYLAVLEFLDDPGNKQRLDGLLKQLEHERTLQQEDGTFLLDDVCASP